ncbi:leukosialin [Mauremys reevesii]|uniref:leukosialin n=1 Tax=Mauremys reevesii TaxID=260615 RepID=UPI0019401F46|nr:leukosialin [Mauremys reevesii]
MAVSGAWPQPKIRPTLLLLLVAAACAQMSLEEKETASEESRHIGTSPETASASAQLARNSTELSAELARNSTEPSAELARHPPTAAQQEPTAAQTPAMKDSVGSVSPSGLPSTEATVALRSGLAGPTAAGGEQPVTDVKLKGQAGTVAGSPGPGQETQTVPGRGGQSTSAPMEPAKGTDRSRHNQTAPASTHRTGRYRAAPDQTSGPWEKQPTPKLSPPALSLTPPAKKQEPVPKDITTPTSSPALGPRKLSVIIIVVLLVVAIVVLALLSVALHCRRRRRCGSTSFSGGPGPGEWAGPVSLPEEKGEGQAGDGGQQAGLGEGRPPTLTTFFGKRHSRVSSVAMEDVAGARAGDRLSADTLDRSLPGRHHSPVPA